MIYYLNDDEYIIGPGMALGGALGEANIGTNLGAGLEVYEGKSGLSLRFRSIVFDPIDFNASQSATELNVSLKNKEYLYLQASCMGYVSNTPGYFSISSINQLNPSGLALTQPSNQYSEGMLCPWFLIGNWEIINIKIVVCAASISISGTPSLTATYRIDFYRQNTGDRTFIQTERLPCIDNAAGIEINNNLTPAANLITFGKDTFSPPITPETGKFLGFEFINEAGSVDTINSMCRATAMVVLTRT